MAGTAARGLDRLADRWWTLVAGVYAPAVAVVGWHRGLDELVAGVSSGRVLDVGCGPAYLARVLMARGVTYVGLDRNAAMVSRAHPRIGSLPGRGQAVRADLAALPFPDGSFDVVVATGVLGLLDRGSRAAALRDIARVSKAEVRLLEPVHRTGRPMRLARARLIGLVRDRPIDLAELAAAGLHVESLGASLLAGVYTPVRAVKD